MFQGFESCQLLEASRNSFLSNLALRTRSLRLGDSATHLLADRASVEALRTRSLRLGDSATNLLADRASVEVSRGPRVQETEAISFCMPLEPLLGHQDVLGSVRDATSAAHTDRASLELSNRTVALEPGTTTTLVPIRALGRDPDDCLLVYWLLVHCLLVYWLLVHFLVYRLLVLVLPARPYWLLVRLLVLPRHPARQEFSSCLGFSSPSSLAPRTAGALATHACR